MRKMTTATPMKAIRTTLIMMLALCGQYGWAEEGVDAAATEAAVEDAASATTESQPEQASESTEELLKEDRPESYLVVKGDTLWGIASRFLKNPWMWPEIWHVNPQIANPHLIYPGDTVKLIYLEGGPKITVKRGEAGMTYTLSPSDDMASVSGTAEVDNQVGKDGKLQPQIRPMPLEEPIPAIPLDVIDPFLSGNRIVSHATFESAPYVVQGAQRHIISGAGDRLFARGEFNEARSTYGFFRKGKVYRDPVTNELLGMETIELGAGKMVSKEKDIGSLSVLRANQEIIPGDRLLTNQERRVDSTFFPSAPKENIQGEILDTVGGVSQAGAMSVVLINKGEREGIESGHVLAIFQRGEVVMDPVTGKQIKLPNDRAGLLMVFAPFEKMSYALVLYADRPLTVGDVVRKP